MKKIIALYFIFHFLSSLNSQTFETPLPFIKNPDEITYDYLNNGNLLVVCDTTFIQIDENGEIVNLSTISPISNFGSTAISNDKIFITENWDNELSIRIYNPNGILLHSATNSEQIGIRTTKILSDSIIVAWYFANSNNSGIKFFDLEGHDISKRQISLNSYTDFDVLSNDKVLISGLYGKRVLVYDFHTNHLEEIITNDNVINDSEQFGDPSRLVILSELSDGFKISSWKDSQFSQVLIQDGFGEYDNDFWMYPKDLISSDVNLAVIGETVETGEIMEIRCYTSGHQIVDTLILLDSRRAADFSNKGIANKSGGYVFANTRKVNPNDPPFNSSYFPVIISVDSTCKYQTQQSFSGFLFNDSNNNRKFDDDEDEIPNAALLIQPDSIYIYSDKKGFYELPTGLFDQQIKFLESQCYVKNELIFTSRDSLNETGIYNIPINRKDNRGDNPKFNFALRSNRCNAETVAEINMTNSSCTPLQGEFEIINLELATLVDSSVILNKEFSHLVPQGSENLNFVIKIANETFTGDTIKIHTRFTNEDIAIDTIFKEVIRCGFDPNDKSVYPVSESSDSIMYSLTNTGTVYTIRFQNEGNDTTFNVRVEDTLSALYDMKTFIHLSSSHNYRLQRKDSSIIYHFDNINIPPKILDDARSQGYITFSILPLPNIQDFTQVKNTAYIYFDFNQPIQTNTVRHTFVSSYDKDLDSFYFWDDCDDSDANVFPGATELPNNQVDENCDGLVLMIDEDMDGFNSSEDCNDLDSLVNPSAVEIPNNEIDENCDGEILIIDADMDGFNSDEDCDDTNPNINPEAEEIADNGIDENCDGEDLISSSFDEIENTAFKIFPNPSRHLVYIESSIDDSYNLTIYRMDGTLIAKRKVKQGDNLVVEKLDPGLYYIRATCDNAKIVVNSKIVIQ